MSRFPSDYRTALAPFSHSLAGMVEYLHAIEDDELLKLQAACGAVSTTNCWCFDYAAANLMKDYVAREIQQRKLSADNG